MGILVLDFSQDNCSSSRNVKFYISNSVELFYRVLHMCNLVKTAVSFVVGGDFNYQFSRIGIDGDQDMLQGIGSMEVECEKQILTSKAQRLLRCFHQLKIGHCLIENSVLLTQLNHVLVKVIQALVF